MKSYDDAFKSRMMFNIHVPLPNYEERASIWRFHLNENIPRTITYDELAQLTDGLSGRNIRQITMTLGIRLTVGKIKSIDREVVVLETEKIKESITGVVSDVVRISEDELPESVKNKI